MMVVDSCCTRQDSCAAGPSALRSCRQLLSLSQRAGTRDVHASGVAAMCVQFRRFLGHPALQSKFPTNTRPIL